MKNCPSYSSSVAKLSTLLGAVLLSATFSTAFAQTLDKETKEDIQRHRAMASAHENAAKCLEAGKKDEVCEKELQATCKGLAVGKYCGMKHVH
ncbi:MAG: hypothetical protein ABIP46_13580 [Polaromonas sp.]